MRTLWICFGLVLLGWGLPRSALAYCLTHTCEFSGTELCTWDAERGCWTGGTVARWGSSCIHYAVHADGSRQEGILASALAAALATGFRTWSGVACGVDGLTPALTAVERGLTRCDQVEFNCATAEANDNIVLFRDGRSDLAATTIALTTTVANISTGQILDVDVEINSAAFDFYVAERDARPDAHDLQLVLNHELGHFLGLSHTLEPGALMRAEYDAADREPAADDIAGICQSLQPSRSDPECSIGPSPGTCVGTDASCPEPPVLHDDGGCALRPDRPGNGRSGVVLLLTTGLLLLARTGFTRRTAMAKQNAQPPKGTRDFLPAYVRQRRYAESIIRKVYESYGFEPLETPALERLEALSGKYGEEGDQLMFKVLLRGQPLVTGIEQAAALLQDPSNVVEGRSGKTLPGAPALLADLGLRYDLTVPLARAYAAHQAELPAVFKRYQIQPVWRADTPGKGRYREFYQCDVDVVGSTSMLVEAEVASAAVECVERLGFSEFTLRLNHRGLLRAVVERAGLAPEQEVDAITAIDKLDKVGPEGVDRELAERGVAESARRALLELLASGASLDSVAQFLAGHAEGEKALSELRRMLELSQATAAGARLRFDIALARGLGYYTGCIFELSSPKFGGSLGGGGRYDNLIGLFLGRSVPACGFSLGFERLLLLMDEGGLFPADLAALDVLLGSTSEDGSGELLLAARELRELGLRVSLLPRPEKAGKLRKTAEEQQARHAVWLDSGRFQLWTRASDVSVRDLERPALLAKLRGETA